MKQKARTLVTIATILFCFGAATADATAMPELIATIRNAKDVGTAARSYAQGRNLDKNNVELYDAYMRKMLTLGYPKIALYAAMELRRLQVKNGTAWGVIGYDEAKRYRYSTAFESAIRAMELLPDDPGVQHNAGVLMAWYESLRFRPKLAPELHRTLAENRKQWLERVKYAEAYRKYKAEFATRAKRIAELKAELARAERDADAADRQSRQAIAQYQDYAWEMARIERDAMALEQRLVTVERESLEIDNEDERPYYDNLIIELRRSIRDDESKLRSMRTECSQYRTRAVQKAELLSKARQALNKAKKALAVEEKDVPKIDWQPPAVDGAITPEDPNPPRFATDAGLTSKPTPASSAESQLKIAKLLMQNDRMQRAAAMLAAIIEKYPDTKAAEEAGRLLQEHKDEVVGDF